MGMTAHYQADLIIIRNDKSETLLDIHDEIEIDDEDYMEEDTKLSFVITQEFIDSLKPGDKLVLRSECSRW